MCWIGVFGDQDKGCFLGLVGDAVTGLFRTFISASSFLVLPFHTVQANATERQSSF